MNAVGSGRAPGYASIRPCLSQPAMVYKDGQRRRHGGLLSKPGPVSLRDVARTKPICQISSTDSLEHFTSGVDLAGAHGAVGPVCMGLKVLSPSDGLGRRSVRHGPSSPVCQMQDQRERGDGLPVLGEVGLQRRMQVAGSHLQLQPCPPLGEALQGVWREADQARVAISLRADLACGQRFALGEGREGTVARRSVRPPIHVPPFASVM